MLIEKLYSCFSRMHVELGEKHMDDWLLIGRKKKTLKKNNHVNWKNYIMFFSTKHVD